MNHLVSICFLAFSSGLLSGFSKFSLSMWLRSDGANLFLLNMFTWTMFPSIFRPFWMPFIENWDILPFKFGLKKNLIIVCDLVIFLMTLCLPFFSLHNESKLSLFLFLTFYAIVIATKDSIGIGYKMEFVPKDEVASYESKVSICYQIGATLTSAVLIMGLAYIDWHYIFMIISYLFLFVLILDFFLMNSCYVEQKSRNFYEKFSAPYVDLMHKNSSILFYLIAFIMFYKIADRMLVGNLNYYVLDAGLSHAQLGNLKLMTTVYVIVANFIGAILLSGIALEKVLLFNLIAYTFVPLSIFLNIKFHIFANYNVTFLYCVYIFDKMLKAIQWNCLFAYQSQFCSVAYMSSQNALFSLFERGICTLLAPFIGFILQGYGYEAFFLIVTLSVIPSFFVTLFLFYKRRGVVVLDEKS